VYTGVVIIAAIVLGIVISTLAGLFLRVPGSGMMMP
jgi:hypothetical protein